MQRVVSIYHFAYGWRRGWWVTVSHASGQQRHMGARILSTGESGLVYHRTCVLYK